MVNEAVLVVGMSASSCSACNQETLTDVATHGTVSGLSPGPGCGATFVGITSEYGGDADKDGPFRAATMALRPDLPWVEYTSLKRD